MEKGNLPLPDKNGIVQALPEELSGENRKRIGKFGTFMFMYDLIQNHWVRPRIHKANPQTHREIMHELITSVKGAVVLDIACGTGGAMPHFDTSTDYTGLDLSYAMLRQAVKKAKARGFRKYTLVEGTAENLPFYDQSFDLVLIDTSLHMIPEYPRCASEASRVLKKGGHLICSCPTVGINPEFDTLWKKIAPKRMLHSFKESDLQALCSDNGLVYEHIGTNGGVLYFRGPRE